MDKIQNWYESPHHQLEVLKRINDEQKWGFTAADFPSVPLKLSYMSAEEILLLVAYLRDHEGRSGFHRTFDELWNLVPAPSGFDKRRHEMLRNEHVRLAPDRSYHPGIRWVVFNPHTFVGHSPKEAAREAKRGGVTLAGIEVLMAAVLFPKWVSSWKGTTPQPMMSALQFYWPNDWRSAPYIGLERGSMKRMLLSARWDTYGVASAASPTIRELI